MYKETVLSVIGGTLGSLLIVISLFAISTLAAPTQAPPGGNPAFPLVGPEGPQGAPGPAGSGWTSVIAVHSQTSSIPNCPTGWSSLWTGYSLLGMSTEGGYDQGFDLGKSGSCAPSINDVSPLIECSNPSSSSCHVNTPGDWTYWLSNRSTDVGQTSSGSTYISRCNVCEKTAAVLTRHSFSTSVPSCPTGWTQLWTGYSFNVAAGSPNVNFGQDLSSPGSCLQRFHPIPFTECNGDTTCDYYTSGDYAGWVTYGGSISRCAVCSK